MQNVMYALISFIISGFDTLRCASHGGYDTCSADINKYRDDIYAYNTQSDLERLKGDFTRVALDMRNGFEKVVENGKAPD